MHRLHAILALLLAFAVYAAAPRAMAEDDDGKNDPGFAYYEKQAAKILKSAGDKVWDAAEHAFRVNLFYFAHEQAQRALTFDPDQKDAREYLKYEKKGKEWVQNEEDYAKLKKDNVRGGANGKQISEEAFAEIIKKWQDERLKAADEFVAQRYAKLGDDCAAKGFPLQAKKGYEYSLRLDPENKAARKGLGFRKFGRVWLTEKQDEARKAASKGVEIKEDSAIDGMFGVTENKVQSEHFRVESELPVEELMHWVEAAETAYAYYLADMEIDPTVDVFGRRALIIWMQDGDQWNKWVDKYGGSDKEFTRSMGGTGDGDLVHGGRIQANSNEVLRTDGVLHQAVHMINRKLWKDGKRAWLDEGLAYYYSIKVQETCLHHCVAKKEGNYAKPGSEGGIKDWNDPANWKPLVKEFVTAKNDTPLRTVVNKPLTQLDFSATIKAWSVITWLMDTDRAKFLEYFDQMKTNGKNQEAIMQGLWGKGLEELDEEWQAYVKRNY